MLSSYNVRELNDQIERELKIVKSILSDDEDKVAALERIARLKKLLTPPAPPQPSRQEILEELASAIVQKAHMERDTSIREFCFRLADVISR